MTTTAPVTEPITLDQVTDDLLAPIHRVADESRLPQTVWPSKWVGGQFMGLDCLLTSMAMPVRDQKPADAAEGADPLVTVLPRHYSASNADYLAYLAGQ